MKRALWILCAVVMVLSTTSKSQTLTFGFANGTVTGTSPQVYEFDITVYASAAGYKAGDIGVYFNYNTAGFGSDISNTNKMTSALGTHFTNGVYYIIENDNTSSRAAITMAYPLTGTETFAIEIPTTPTVLFHIEIEILDPDQTAGLSFEPPLMQAVDYTGASIFTLVATDTDDHTLPVELSTFDAAIEKNNVKIRWITESEINNAGFHLYRSKATDGPFEQINGALIPGAGNSTEPREYSFIDNRVEPDQDYHYKLADVDIYGKTQWHGPISVNTAALNIPDEYQLKQNYPNPFNPTTTIQYALPEDQHVQLEIFNTRGEKVKTLVNAFKAAGTFQIQWDGSDDQGTLMPTGLYFYKLKAGSFQHIRKMLFTK
jgi:hypothetical protein